MTTQFRDTQLGYVVRFLSSNKLFRYPDEIDSSLWKESIQRDTSSKDKRSGKQNGALEKPQEPNDATNASPTDVETQGVGLQDAEHVVEAGKDIYLVDWYGPDDPENPRNWPRRWKLLVAFQICLINFSIYIASSIYVPGEASIMKDFGVGGTVTTLGLSLYTWIRWGPMLWSPLSEMPIVGRSGIYFWTHLIYVLLQLPTGFAVNMPMFLVFRVFTGFFGSPGLATGGGTLADICDPARLTYGLCIWGSFGILGPVFGPIIGGYTVPAKGWRWTIWVVTWLGALVVAVIFFFFPETSEANILYVTLSGHRCAKTQQKKLVQLY